MKKRVSQIIFFLLILKILTGCTALNEEKYSRKDQEFYKTKDETLANSYFFEKKYEYAISHYKNIIDQTRNNTTIVNYAWCLYYTNKVDQADILLRRHYPKAIDKRQYLYALVFTSWDISKPAKSESYLNELIGLDPYFADTTAIREIINQTQSRNLFLKKFANNYFELGDFQRTYNMLIPYLHKNQHDCDARLKEAWCDLYLGRLMISVTEFDSILRRTECNRNQAMVGKGVALFYLKMYEEAVSAFSEATSMNPDDIRPRVALGAVSFMKGHYQKAIDIYTKYLNQLPKKELYFSWSSHALNNLGWSYIYIGKHKKALEIFSRLTLHHDRPIYPQPFFGEGWAYFYMNKIDKAKHSFNHALTLDPDNALVLNGLKQIELYKKHKPSS